MQENIQPRFEMRAIENTLLTRDYLMAKKRADNLEQLARNQAKKVVNQAWHEVEEIKTRAFQEGFDAGLIFCVENIVDHFNAVERTHQTLRSNLEQELLSVMNEVFMDNTIFFRFVSDWYKKNRAGDVSDVVVSLPENQSQLANQICTKLRTHLLTEPKIIFHQHPYYQVKIGDQLLEFNPQEFTTGLVRRLIDNNDAIRTCIANMSAESLQQLYSLFNKEDNHDWSAC